ncbi:Uu.00g006770.m01.CDS01 [Anthostomella pinea]|uniref:Uu.00g006770.m01.CDS01 n=1 Tax=Anthostomella pinea TaxID=933095 RepID=A0AAI8VL10_9PEZI|nr:Uu.00g006770.m01.CDS01 [Anthostomella pinea]
MVSFNLAAALALALTVLAIPSPLTPDPSGDKNIGNGKAQQFIGGACLGAADCASTCCAFLSDGGICSGLGASTQAGKKGCGFEQGGAAPPATSTTAPAGSATGVPASGAINPNEAGSQNVGLGNGSQFITGQCLSDADCASACCAIGKGQCAAKAVATCGFVAA